MSGWQPISTAPRDGTKVALRNDRFGASPLPFTWDADKRAWRKAQWCQWWFADAFGPTEWMFYDLSSAPDAPPPAVEGEAESAGFDMARRTLICSDIVTAVRAFEEGTGKYVMPHDQAVANTLTMVGAFVRSQLARRAALVPDAEAVPVAQTATNWLPPATPGFRWSTDGLRQERIAPDAAACAVPVGLVHMVAAPPTATPAPVRSAPEVGEAEVNAAIAETAAGGHRDRTLMRLALEAAARVRAGAQEERAGDEAAPLRFTYRNHRGEVATRTVRPISVSYGATEWHPEPGWLLRAYDLDKQAEREFAMADIGASPPPTPDAIAAARREERERFQHLVERLRDDARRGPVAVSKAHQGGFVAGCEYVLHELRALSPAPSSSTGEGGRLRPIRDMTDAELVEEDKRLAAMWEDRDDDGHCGAPGEWINERSDEIATEQNRRAALRSAQGAR